MSANFESATYPYERVHPSYLTFKGAEELPKKLLLYLLDLPDASALEVVAMHPTCRDGSQPPGRHLDGRPSSRIEATAASTPQTLNRLSR